MGFNQLERKYQKIIIKINLQHNIKLIYRPMSYSYAQRNLNLPSIFSTKNDENNKQLQRQNSYRNTPSQVQDVLKMIQKKKQLLQKKSNQNQQQSGDSDDETSDLRFQTNQKLSNLIKNQKYRILAMKNQPNQLYEHKNIMRSFLAEHETNYYKDIKYINPIEGKMRLDRIKTENNQNQYRSVAHCNKVKPMRIQSKVQEFQLLPYLTPKQISERISKLISEIPKKLKERNEITLKQITTFLQQYNPFFMKLQKIVAICLLKVCSILKKDKRQIILEKQEPHEKFFLVLSGKVKISNKSIDLRKICYPGETVGQQIWMTYLDKKCGMVSYERCRALGDTIVLEIQIQKFKKVKEQLVKFGFKSQYNQLQAIIKRNHIVKNALRLQKNRF